ncbi:early nodulin-like protein 1 [Punica granatum]|uniref:Uncharacterized protein n=2 Tax=Punica granatum TaxID=22663 RepID=A0A2I0KHJ3_PUNGR|nr:early nodulin-like protein 1 [Punica granatum]PKI67663.1 hypothetical protein CRG98_011876 [Punica granatum]
MGRGTSRNIGINVSHVIGFVCLILIHARRSNAFEFSVGGNGKWSAPSDNSSNPFNQWAERMRFQIGDSLVFTYKPNEDSVLYVAKDAFDSCNTYSYISKYVDGHTVFKFNQSGPFFFISGVKENCLKYEKLHLVVLADRSNKTAAPSPSPSEGGPAAATPSPAPSGEESPSPPAGTVEINPTPAPTSETSPPPPSSSPRLALIGFTGSIAAFVAPSALLFL